MRGVSDCDDDRRSGMADMLTRRSIIRDSTDPDDVLPPCWEDEENEDQEKHS